MTGKRPAPPFFWCSRCGARRALLGGVICRICIARPGRLPDHANRPRARTRYRAAGLCRCGGERDRADRLACARCRRLQAEATLRYRAAHPPDRARLYADVHARRQRRLAAGLCADCGGPRDRADRKLCERCRRLAATATRAYRARGKLRSATPGAPETDRSRRATMLNVR